MRQRSGTKTTDMAMKKFLLTGFGPATTEENIQSILGEFGSVVHVKFPSDRNATLSSSSLVTVLCLSIFLGLSALSAVAAPIWLVATPKDTLRSDEPVVLNVIRPSSQDGWPYVLKLQLEQDSKACDAKLSVVEPVAKDDTWQTYRARICLCNLWCADHRSNGWGCAAAVTPSLSETTMPAT